MSSRIVCISIDIDLLVLSCEGRGLCRMMWTRCCCFVELLLFPWIPTSFLLFILIPTSFLLFTSIPISLVSLWLPEWKNIEQVKGLKINGTPSSSLGTSFSIRTSVDSMAGLKKWRARLVTVSFFLLNLLEYKDWNLVLKH